MQPIFDSVYIEDSLQKLDTTARKIGKYLKRVAKFLLAVFVYFVLNACVILLFNNVRPASMEFVRLMEYGLRVFTSENVTIIISIFSQYKFVSYSLAFVATALSFMLEFSDKADVAPIFETKQNTRKIFSQKTVRRISVFSYKQHVAFLA